MTEALIEIPARRGKAARLGRGQSVRVVNTFGTQVVDTWAFAIADSTEFMSMEHTRVSVGKLAPGRGEAFVTNRRRPILTLVADDTPGVHDTLLAACDTQRYALLGHAGHHDNCTDNLRAALAELGLSPPATPCPLNLFMNIPFGADGRLQWVPTLAKPGDGVTLRAEMDCVIAFSACPMDLVPINGVECVPRAAHFSIQ
jgi:uncharacterized protein YcgI (DUF1989 family)